MDYLGWCLSLVSDGVPFNELRSLINKKGKTIRVERNGHLNALSVLWQCIKKGKLKKRSQLSLSRHICSGRLYNSVVYKGQILSLLSLFR